MPIKYTKEIVDFIRDNVKGISNKELVRLVNERFGEDTVTETAIHHIKTRYKLKNGLCHKFKKGHLPANKGAKMSDELKAKVSATWFKKGHLPHNTAPLGTETIDKKDGYIRVKVNNTRNKDVDWKYKHHIVWEEHYGKVPKGCNIIFLDGNKQNVNIDNLACVTNNELCRLNQHGLIFDDAKLTETGINIARVKIAINEAKKKDK